MKDKQNYLSKTQFDDLVNAIPQLKIKSLTNKDVEMMLKLSYYLGLRISETITLKKSSFDLDECEVELGETKTENNALASIPPSFIKELEKYLSTKIDGFLFLNSYTNKLITRQTVWVWLKKLGQICNIRALTTPLDESHEMTKTHIFRKSIGKDMLYQNAPLNVIMKKLRHTSLDMTTRYLKLQLDDVKAWERQNL